jgi:CxxC motif-containing protein (DUF1111 family)
MTLTASRLVMAGLALLILLVISCSKPTDGEPSDLEGAYYAGGAMTTFNAGSGAYSQTSANLTGQWLSEHLAGEVIFHTPFTELEDPLYSGLGPLFIHHSCAECHSGNGRSHPPVEEGDNSSGLLLRLSIAGQDEHGQPMGVPGYGTQLQTHSVAGIEAEGKFYLTHENIYMPFPDGTELLLQQPYYTIYDTYSEWPQNVLRSPRNAPPVFGLGLLEAVPEADILSRVDEQDNNGDYISGKANYVWSIADQQMKLGRLGWKASSPGILQQTAEALHQDMGITSPLFFPVEACIGQSNCNADEYSEGPEISSSRLKTIALYLRTLAVPAPRSLEDAEVKRGKELFETIHCAACHVPELRTGYSDIPALSYQTIHPYTDLLLHDLGEGLGDGRPDYLASANEWRTAPLWGIGLSEITSPDGTYLHDGRARTLEEAILWHGGEAYWSRNSYMELSLSDRKALLRFLRAL